jgi:Mg-chelatase subunit ChlD
MAAGLLVLVGSIGLATDTARGYLVKARLSQALDAAGLAGGRAIFSPNRDADILMYFHANYPANYMNSTVTEPTIVADTTNGTIAVSASATLPTTLMQIFGINQIDVSSMTEVTRQTQMLDVVLAIDMSGSMTSWTGGQTRIQAARGAATQLVNILFGADAIKNLLKIGVVPWNSKVNVGINGVTYDSALTTSEAVPGFTNPLTGAVQSTIWKANHTPVPLLSAPPSDWKGCVYQRYLDNAATDDDGDIVLGDLASASGDWVAWEPLGPESEPVPGWADCASSVDGGECGACLSHGITPLSSVKQDVLDAIGELLNPSGQTNIPQGLGWAWRVLAPGAPFDEADPNPPGNRQQAIVLLTDGENVGGNGDSYKTIWGTGSSARPEMNDRLRDLAANIKAAGVVIYTIQFANSGTSMQTLLKQVATGPDAPYYHYAPDGAALEVVFQEIANHLSQLRLSM